MPQMAPTIWLNMMFWILVMMMTLTTIVYFFNASKMNESSIKSTSMKSKKLSW